MICPITKKNCIGLTCSIGTLFKTSNYNIISCEKAHKDKIYLLNKDGSVKEIWTGEKK